MNKLSRSEQKRFDEARRLVGGWTRGQANAQDCADTLHRADLLDLRSPARKAAEAKVLEAAKMRFACCSLATHQLLDSEVRALNDVIASESAPSVEWRKRFNGCAQWVVDCLEDGRCTGGGPVPGNTEAAADVLVAHLNSVERGKC